METYLVKKFFPARPSRVASARCITSTFYVLKLINEKGLHASRSPALEVSGLEGSKLMHLQRLSEGQSSNKVTRCFLLVTSKQID